MKSFATINGNHIAYIQMADNLGRVVKTVSLKDATNPTLSVGGLQAGVYHLRVQTTDGKVSGASLVVRKTFLNYKIKSPLWTIMISFVPNNNYGYQHV